MKKLTFVLPLSLATAMAAVTGCSSNPGPTTTADHMRGHATDQQAEVDQQKQFAKDWEEGNELVSEGRQDVKQGTEKVRKGEESIREGKNLIAEGESKIEQGRQQMRNAKQGFQEDNPGVDLQVSD